MTNIICILGPTAVGKTDFAFTLANHYPVHLISVDSAQIYRGLDIGSAKPNAMTLIQYPHALINICEPEETYSAAQFCHDAKKEIQYAKANNKIPVLVGGTMLYYLAYFEGLSDLPTSTTETRTIIEKRIEQEGTQSLYHELVQRDPQTATKISPNDRQRLTRFIELMMLTGKTPSQLYTEQSRTQQSHRILAFALNTERTVLHQRIAKRFEQMVREGLIDEVNTLKKRPNLTADHPSMRCVGYRQIWEHLEGYCDKPTAIERSIIATRQLAKRQITWMNNRLKTALPLQFFDSDKKNQKLFLNKVEQFLIP